MNSNRRTFLQAGALGSISLALNVEFAWPSQHRQVSELAGKMGIVTASAHAQMTGKAIGRHFTLLDFPKIMRDELDLEIVDLNTMSFPDFAMVDRAYLDKLRSAVDDAGCLMTNLKMNQRGIDINSPDKNVRDKAMNEYKRSIDIAAQLGCRWARPLPGRMKPDSKVHINNFRRLCDYAADRKVTMLVENFGWMQSDPNSIASLIQAIGDNVAAGVDTGNWTNNEVRYAGLKKSFPLAATCDFKAKRFDDDGSHPQYDLKRCFDIAWNAGFRGPWALEHGNSNTQQWFVGVRRLRDLLRTWLSEKIIRDELQHD